MVTAIQKSLTPKERKLVACKAKPINKQLREAARVLRGRLTQKRRRR
jgi:hypothetical protein